MAGVDLVTVASILGHKTLAMTQRCNHLSPAHRLEAVEALSAASKAISRAEEVVRGAGFEAEMRKAVDEATATVAELRSVAATTARATLTDLMAGNFMESMTLRERLKLHDELVRQLRAIGVSEAEVRRAEEMWNRGIGVIFHRGVRHCLEGRTKRSTINVDAGEDLLKASREFQDLLNFSEWKAPSSAEIRAFIEDRNAMNEDVDELLKDFQHFEETGEFRCPKIFENL